MKDKARKLELNRGYYHERQAQIKRNEIIKSSVVDVKCIWDKSEIEEIKNLLAKHKNKKQVYEILIADGLKPDVISFDIFKEVIKENKIKIKDLTKQ